MINQKLAKFFSSDVGIDLGTANCLVFVKDKGKFLKEFQNIKTKCIRLEKKAVILSHRH